MGAALADWSPVPVAGTLIVAVLVPDWAPTALTSMVLPAWLALKVYSRVRERRPWR